MTGKTPRHDAQPAGDLPADAVPVETAARLLGLTASRIAQLVRDGRAIRPRRGFVNLVSLLRGYTDFLRTEAGGPASDSLSRSHAAKAATTEAAVAARRAELMPRASAEEALAVIEGTALRHLRSLTSATSIRGLPPEVAAALKAEVKTASAQIEAAHGRALAFLRDGDERHLGGTE